MGQANHSQLPNTIWVWQLGWLASQPGCQLGGKHHLHLGRAEMVQARKQGALHRLDQVIPDLGWSGRGRKHALSSHMLLRTTTMEHRNRRGEQLDRRIMTLHSTLFPPTAIPRNLSL
jgi:hypothetical protein